jgi:hypothetical protein
MIERLDLARVLVALLFLGQSNDQDRFHPARQQNISGALKVEISSLTQLAQTYNDFVPYH